MSAAGAELVTSASTSAGPAGLRHYGLCLPRPNGRGY